MHPLMPWHQIYSQIETWCIVLSAPANPSNSLARWASSRQTTWSCELCVGHPGSLWCKHNSWANRLAALVSGHARYLRMLVVTFDTWSDHICTPHTEQDAIFQVLPCRGWAGSETSEYYPAWKPMSSENQVSPYKVRSNFINWRKNS